jgi:tRNA threonylcarbamoyladenosine biosynthesis protein TsaE
MEIMSWKKVYLADLNDLTAELKESLKQPCVIFLLGEVGVGKTTLVKSFINDDSLTSPTYSLVQDYGPYLHADFYRLESSQELSELGLEYYLEKTQIFFIEWGEKYDFFLRDLLGDGFHFYQLEIQIDKIKDKNFSPEKNILSEAKRLTRSYFLREI